jgi:hypothetical protein
MGTMLPFEPPRRSRIVTAIAFAPLLIVTAFFTWTSLHAATLGARLSEHVERRTGDGPVAMKGTIRPMPDAERTPLGEDPAAWAGAVGWWTPEGDGLSEFIVTCPVGRFDGVALRTSEGIAYRMAMVRPDERVRLLEEGAAYEVDDRFVVDIGPVGKSGGSSVREVPRDAIPAVVKETCGKEIAEGTFGLGYRERALRSDKEVTVLACKHGNDLVPCRDGLDLVTVESLEKTKSRLAGNYGSLLLLGGLVSLIALASAGYVALSFVSRTRRAWK